MKTISKMQMAQLDVLNLVRDIQTEGEYVDFWNMLARYFADKAQKQIDLTLQGNNKYLDMLNYLKTRYWHEWVFEYIEERTSGIIFADNITEIDF